MKFLSFLCTAVPALMAFLAFDALVRIEYESHRNDWERDGRPHGIFWVPEEARVLGGWLVSWSSSIASRRCAFVWLFSTPKWALRNKSAKRILLWWRLLVGIWGATFVAVIILFVFGLP